MLDKDKLHIVVSIGVKGIDFRNIPSYIHEIQNVFKTDESVKMYYIPSYETKKINMECINPVYFSDELVLQRMELVIKKLEENLNKIVNKN